MKNINKDILKQLEKDNFSKEIINDPLRLAYYTALKGYKEYLSTANLEGTPQSTAKFKKYNKDLLEIMNTDMHVVYLLLSDLDLNKKLSCEYYSPLAGDKPYWHLRFDQAIYVRDDACFIGESITHGKRNTLIMDYISKLFPILVFAKYKTSHLKEVITLLAMKIDANITGIHYGKMVTKDDLEKYGFGEKDIRKKYE